jgi:hypothetical protein
MPSAGLNPINDKVLLRVSLCVLRASVVSSLFISQQIGRKFAGELDPPHLDDASAFRFQLPLKNSSTAAISFVTW